jgi:Spy/CpxP family protein refolding chaperone
MKTGRIIFFIAFLLSLSLNTALLINRFSRSASTSPASLNLTAQQKKNIAPIRLKTHRANESLKAEIAKCQRDLLEALKSDPVDRTAVSRCIENISDLQKKIQLNTIEEIIEVKKHIDPHQCNCLVQNMSTALGQDSKACDCPHCSTGNKSN